MESSLFFLVAVIAGGLFVLWMILYFIPIGLWFQALVSDVKISLLQLVLMRWPIYKCRFRCPLFRK